MTSHLIHSTAFAVFAVAICLLLKHQRAALRHIILFVAILRFLIPTPWLASAGTRLASCLPSRVLSLPAVANVSLMLRPGKLPGREGRAQSAAFPDASRWIWAAGLTMALGLWLRGQLREIPRVREASSAEIAAFERALRGHGGHVALRIVPPGLSPGVRGLLRPTILLPDGLISELSEVEMDAVLAHEIAHIQRKDLWVAAAARIITCVFWFHPFLWWMERRMLKERETACDELVLAGGASADDYAGAIAKVCRLVWNGSQAYAGIADSNLKQRMEHIMTCSLKTTTKTTAPRLLQALLGAMATLAVLLPVAGGFLQAQPPAVSNGPGEALYQSCLVDLKAGKYREAEDGFRLLREMEPANPRGLVGEAVAYLREGREDEAVRLVDANPGVVELGFALSDYYMAAGKFDKAIVQLKLLPVGASDAQAALIFRRLGDVERQVGDLIQAMAAFRQAIERNPRDSASMLNVALLLEGTGQREAARQEYIEVLKLDPKNAIALNNLAFIMADGAGSLVEASEYALRAKEALPDSLDVADTLGWIYVRRQMGDEAIATLKPVVIAAPKNVDFRKHLATAMDLKGLNSPAMEELKRVLRSDATEPEAIVSAVKALP